MRKNDVVPQTDPRAGAYMRVAEPVLLALVPAALLACAYWQVQASALFSLVVVALCVVLFFFGYESSQPALRQFLPATVLAALAAAGRIAFAALPDIKPVSALVIVAGACLGKRNGFMTGALAALLSNFFFGQGPWTALQMYAWGLIGYLAGVLAQHGFFSSKAAVYGFGLVSGLIYGAVLNGWHVVGFVSPLTIQTAVAAFMAGLPFDITHGISTAAFLLLIWGPWSERIQKTVRAYGLGDS